MRHKLSLLVITGLLLAAGRSFACIWDAETMLQERLFNPDLAHAILSDPPKPPDPVPLRKRIRDLMASRQENDASWWNDLAGAHLRLGEAIEAAALLETITNRFPNNYGVHANLGTAYHLLGRYQEAEREIARDLEINPDAHFGVERYHLALLQYLIRDAAYQKQHVYIDEWSYGFLHGHSFRLGKPVGRLSGTNTNGLDEVSLNELERHWDGDTNRWPGSEIAELRSFAYVPPQYRYKWDLASDPKFKEGIIYMASMNPKEPACFVMLGIASVNSGKYNLAVAAYERAVKLGSPQSEMLEKRIEMLRNYIWKSHKTNILIYGIFSLIPLVIMIYIISKIRDWRRRSRQAA